MLRKVRLYGSLAKFVGSRVLEADVSTAAEAVRFLVANFEGLEQHMADKHYKVITHTSLTADELHDITNVDVIQIVPVVAGAGGPVARILTGIALIAISFFVPFAAPLLLGLGASLVLGGVAQLLTPVPKIGQGEDSVTDTKRSYNFSGIQQTSRAGTPVPLIYGKTLVGSVVISAGISDDVQVADSAAPIAVPFLSYNGTSNTGTDPIGQGTKIKPAAPCPGSSSAVSSWYVNGALAAVINVTGSSVTYVNDSLINQPGTPQLFLSGASGDPGSLILFGNEGDEILNIIECLDGTKSRSVAMLGPETLGAVSYETCFSLSCFYPLGSVGGEQCFTSYGEPMWVGEYDAVSQTRSMYIRNSSGAIETAYTLQPPLGPPPSYTMPNYCTFNGGTGGTPNEPWTVTPIVTLKNAKLNGVVVIDYTAV
jgi:predicted phage tail protein